MLSQIIFIMTVMKGTNLFILAKTEHRYNQERRTHLAVAAQTVTAISLLTCLSNLKGLPSRLNDKCKT